MREKRKIQRSDKALQRSALRITRSEGFAKQSRGDTKIDSVEMAVADLLRRIETASLVMVEAYQSLLAELTRQGSCFQINGSLEEEVRGTDGIVDVLEPQDVDGAWFHFGFRNG